MKEKIFARVDQAAPRLSDLADRIYDFCEVGGSEEKSSALLCDFLEQNGFTVEKGVGGLPTAFRAVFESGEGGPSIGFLCEYDALPGIGHACGHHMQGPSVIGAALGLMELAGSFPFRVVIYGTPDEECTVCGGKIPMLENGCFRDCDVIFTMHAGEQTCADPRTLAMKKFVVTFKGKAGPALITPEVGRSATDAMLLAFQGIEYLREHVRYNTVMHYSVLDGGSVPMNVVPGTAKASFIIRSLKDSHLEELTPRFYDVVNGAAMMSGCTAQIEQKGHYLAKFPIPVLVDLAYENIGLTDAKNVSEPRKKFGSGDFGNVMRVVPGIPVRVCFLDTPAPAHSKEWLEAGKSENAHRAIVTAGKILGGMAHDLISDPVKMEQVKTDYRKALEENSAL